MEKDAGQIRSRGSHNGKLPAGDPNQIVRRDQCVSSDSTFTSLTRTLKVIPTPNAVRS